MDSRKEALEKAKSYAFLLLKFRLRSRKELQARMERKGFSEDVVKDILDFLQEKAFIDDRAFTKAWISSRIKKPLGFLRLRQELKLKGVDKAVIESEINKARKDYSEGDVVLELAKSKLDKLKGTDPYKARNKVFQYLARRGFSPDTITDTLSHL